MSWSKHRPYIKKCLVFLLPFLILLISACSSDNDRDDVDPQPDKTVESLTVTSAVATLVADGASTAAIRATVVDNSGDPVPQVEVDFETTAGTLSKTTQATGSNGVAEVTLQSGTEAVTARVTANAEGLSESVSVDFVAGKPADLQVMARPGNLMADGVSTSQVTITVMDANANLIDNAGVNLSVEYGTLSQYFVTTANGRATVTYRAPSSAPGSNQDRIDAQVRDAEGSINITLMGPQVANIILTADPATLPADGESQSLISADVSLVGGGSVPDGTQVDFTIKEGGGEIAASSTTTDGTAVTVLTSGTVAGEATIRAEVGGRIAEIKVTYTPGGVSLSIVPNSLMGIGGGEQTADVTVTVINAAGEPVDGENVSVKINDLSFGSISPAEGSLVDGDAAFVFTAAPKGGTAIITATWDPADADPISGSATIIIQQPPAFIESAEGYPDPLSVNIVGTGGKATSRIVLNVKDVFGEPVADGYRVDFQILDGPGGGEALEPVSALTRNGQVSTVFRSGSKSGPVNIKTTYYHDTNVSSAISNIAINAGQPVGEEFGISSGYNNMSGLLYSFLQNPVTVNVADVYGNAVPDGTAINFKTYNTGGFFSPNMDNTLGGAASSFLFSGGSYTRPLNGFVAVTAEASSGGRTHHVTSIAVDPADPEILFAGTSGGGVYKSIDAGSTWDSISRTSDAANLGQNYIDPYINDICINPDDPNMVYAATGFWGGGGIYRSIDGGLRWNSGKQAEWAGLFRQGSSVLTVECDGGSDYVWAGAEGLGAVFAPDGESFQWGGKLTAGPVAAPGTPGSLIFTGLGMTALTEKWTAQFVQTGAAISNLEFVDVSNRSADGRLVNMAATGSATDENWTLTYQGGVSAVDESEVANPDLVGLTVVGTSAETIAETWTITCLDNTPGEEEFRVVGSKSGVNGAAGIDENYTTDGNEVTFYIAGAGSFVVGDTFTFATDADGWTVEGSASGTMQKAYTDVPYTSDNQEVSFTIASGEMRFFGEGDEWRFDTRILGNFLVTGDRSGIQNERAEHGIPYTSDAGEVSFVIFDDPDDPFAPGDQFTFEVEASGLGFGRTVRDIERASGAGGSAVLYAGTPSGVYKSGDGGLTWQKKSQFTGNNITTVAVHPDYSNTIYVGTQEYGVWYSTNGGDDWQRFTDGLGGGLRAATPIADLENTGNGTMRDMAVTDNTQSENWVVSFDGNQWEVTGSVSGLQANYASTGTTYTSDDGDVSFRIVEGSIPFSSGDTFRFNTVRDPGLNIKDLQVYHDPANNAYSLYAITYFFGAKEIQAAGNVYAAALDPGSNYAPSGEWAEANMNLPEIDPPNDTTLFAQHALAVDDPLASRELFIGGQGINFYKAVEGLNGRNPYWEESKQGLSNRIMARKMVLFSGYCTMDVTETDFNEDTGEVTYKVYVQDENGNPPIEGSRFYVNVGTTVSIWDLASFRVEYPDAYSYPGTWSDPSDAATDNPYIIRTRINTQLPDDSVTFTFEPRCETEDDEIVLPGCSGSDQKVSFTYYFEQE